MSAAPEAPNPVPADRRPARPGPRTAKRKPAGARRRAPASPRAPDPAGAATSRRLAEARRRAPAPEAVHLVRLGGQWRVRLAVFAPADPAARDPARLRDLLAPHGALLAPHGAPLASHGAPHAARGGAPEARAAEPEAALPDDLLVAAAVAGALTCMPFLDILDGECFARAPCLCCYAAHSAGRAREAGAALRLFQRYYDEGSYLGSRAYARTVAALARDLSGDEVAEVAGFLAALDSTGDAVREINGRWAGRMCVAVPPCRPGALWVYSTADGRRLLRHLARGLRKGGAPVKVTVASSDPAVFPRYRLRMYAAAPAGGDPPAGGGGPPAGGGGPPAGGAAAPAGGAAAGRPAPGLLEAALAWSRAHDPHRPA